MKNENLPFVTGFITTPEAMQFAQEQGSQITSATLRNWSRRYGISKKVGGRWMVNKSKLELLLKGELK